MKNVYEVLRQKEMELTRLEKEVEALRLVAPLAVGRNGNELRHGEAGTADGRERTAAADPHPGAAGGAGGAAGARCRVGRYGQALAVDGAVSVGPVLSAPALEFALPASLGPRPGLSCF